MTEVIGKLSIPSKEDDVESMDSEYKETLKELNIIKTVLKTH